MENLHRLPQDLENPTSVSLASTTWIKRILRLILPAAVSLALFGQSFPSKEYVRLGSRVIAIESAPILTPSSDMTAQAGGETGTPVQIAGSPKAMWIASTSSGWIHITTGGTNSTSSTGQGTFTYNLDPNTGNSPLTGSIEVRMASGTAVYDITQLAPDGISLASSGITVPAAVFSGTVAVTTVPPTLQWTIGSAQSCFTSVAPSPGSISYTVSANTSTSQRTCYFTVTASGATPQTFTVTQAAAGVPALDHVSENFTSTGGQDTINVLNWTGWSVMVNPNTIGLRITSQTATQVQYSVAANMPGSATLTFTDGTTTLYFNVTESSSGSCVSTPTLSLSQSSLSFPSTGGDGRQDPTYAVQITSNANWTASLLGANGLGINFFVSGNSSTGTGAVSLTGTGNQTLYVYVWQTNSATSLSTTLNLITCGGSAAQSENIGISQVASALTVGPSNTTLYQNWPQNPTNIQFTAYYDGPPVTVGWSATEGSIDSSGYYTPPPCISTPSCPFTTVTVTATYSTNGGVFTATSVINITSQPFNPEFIGLTLNSSTLYTSTQSGSGGNWLFEFSPQENGTSTLLEYQIESAEVTFSSSTGGAGPIMTNSCDFTVLSSGSFFNLTLNGTSPYPGGTAQGSWTDPNSNWTPSLLSDAQCSIDLSNLVSNTIGSAPVNTINTVPFWIALPIQFYGGFAGTKGIWATTLENNDGVTVHNLLMAEYNVVASQSVSPASVTMNLAGSQQFTALASGTPIPSAEVTWNAPSPNIGMMTTSGLYTAPSSISSPQTVSISGSLDDGSAVCCATVTLMPVAVAAVSPSSVSLQINQTQNFTATVTGTSNAAVTWALSPSDPTAGSLMGSLYTAPATIPVAKTVTITAKSVADPTKSLSGTITLVPDALVISPSGISLDPGQSQQFVATVNGTTNGYVTWSINPTGVGTFNSSTGYYTAPNSVTAPQTLVITATSVADQNLIKSINVSLSPAWYSGGWSGRKAITINGNQVVGTSALLDFPVLISISNDSDLAAKVQQPQGQDILFTQADGMTVLPREIEFYQSNNGAANLIAWVQVPSLSPGINTVIYMYYGNSSPPQQNATGVWDSNYKAVWHMNNNAPNATVTDSTSNTANGTETDTTTTTGQIDGALRFNGTSDYITLAPNSNFALESGFTLEAWVQDNTAAGSFNTYLHRILSWYDGSHQFDFGIGEGAAQSPSAGERVFYITNQTARSVPQAATVGNAPVGLNHVVATYDGTSTYNIYLNGVNANGGTMSEEGSFFTSNKTLYLGQLGGGNSATFLVGTLDEVRISNIVRPAGWITTEYNNQHAPASFISLSGAQAVVVAPVFSPPGGSYSTIQSVTISSSTPGASIRYTTDGSTPSETAGNLYSGPFPVNANVTINAIAYENGFADSSIASAVYQISWYNNAWNGRKSITIYGSQVAGTSALPDFPVLVSTSNDPDLQAHAQPNGNDILFTDSTGMNVLPYEIEQYSNGNLIAWVQVPLLSPGTNTLIYMYYGNSSASSQQNSTQVWANNNYTGVWHLATGTGGSLVTTDSTGNGNNGTNDGATATPGHLDGAANFSGSSGYIDNGSNNGANGLYNGTLTVSAWVNTTGASGTSTAVSEGDNTTQGQHKNWALEQAQNGTAQDWRFEVEAGTSGTTQYNIWGAAVSPGTWHYLVGVYNGTTNTAYLYVDGGTPTSLVVSGSINQSNTDHFLVGAKNASSGQTAYWNGSIDEVRYSNIARSAGWITTEYNNQVNPSEFYMLGSATWAGPNVSVTSGSPQSAVIGAPFATPLQVTVTGLNNEPLSGQLVTFTAPSTGASATFGGSTTTTATTNSSGIAVAAAPTAITAAGSYNVSASITGTASANFALTNTASSEPVSVTPSSGSVAYQTFTLQYSDTSGAASLQTAWVYFTSTLLNPAVNSCLVYYNVAANVISLAQNGGTTWYSATPGTAVTLANSQCSLAVQSITVALSGNTLTLTLPMTFSQGYAGAKNIYMYAADGLGNSGWQQLGTWTVPSTGPTPVSVTPSSGSTASQTFTLQYSDTSGATSLQTVWVYFTASLVNPAANSCLVYYDVAANVISLAQDVGTTWFSATPGTSTTLQNSQCSLNAAATTVTQNGNTLTLNVPMTFLPAYAGAININMYAADVSGSNSGWQLFGSWMVP